MTDGELEALAGHKLVRVRAGAAAHAEASAELLARLAGDASRTVRRVVAGRPDAPPAVLATLAADPDRVTREAVAANAGTPPGVLISLLDDSHFFVRWAVTTNAAADVRVQKAMCASADQDVRFVLAQMPGLPAEIAGLLARDPARPVRESLAEHTDDPAVLQCLLTDREPQVRAAAALNAGTSAEQRRRLASDPVGGVRASVVYGMAVHGWDLGEEDLLRLARDRSANVRFWVATMPGSTRPVYEILVRDPDEIIADAAGLWLLAPTDPANPGHLPAEILGDLLVQRDFANPGQLGRPIPRLRDDVGPGMVDRLGG